MRLQTQKCRDGLRLTEGQIPNYTKAIYHFQNEVYNEYGDKWKPNFEPTQRVQMWKRTEDLNQFYRNSPPLKAYYPDESEKLVKFVPKGGDIILMEGNDTYLIIAELKFRYKVFRNNSGIIKYCDGLNIKYKSIPVIVDVDNKLAYYQLLNYLKECPERYDEIFCFPEEDLQFPYVREQLDNFKIKDEFSHIIVRDVSFYHELATKDELAVGESMKTPLAQLNVSESVEATKLQVENFTQDSSFKLRNVKKATKFLIENYSNPEDELKIKYERPE